MYKRFFKDILDKILSLIGILFLAPLYIIVSLLILVDDGFPVIYKQVRIGQYGKKFTIYKFRTMVKNADKIGALSTSANDSRITKLGMFLRKSSIDELPQLFNVLKGDMSLIGYRPDVPREDDDYSNIKYTLKPGLSGYAQVYGRSSISAEKKKDLETQYVNDVSFLTDMKIIFLTIYIVVMRKGVN